MQSTLAFRPSPVSPHRFERGNRRWDPTLWHTDGSWWRLNLAADYADERNAKPWWMGANAMELWTGSDPKRLDLLNTWPSPDMTWTAPAVVEVEPGRHVCLTGLMRDGSPPGQRLLLVDPYSMGEIGALPKSPGQYAWGDRVTWRDAWMMRDGDGWLLVVPTGGFRHGMAPQILAYRSERWDGGWWCDGPIVDPRLCHQFAEMERAQLHRLLDGRWALTWSCWPDRQFMHAKAPPLHLAVTRGPDLPVTRYLGGLQGAYGAMLFAGWACGWRWTDRATHSGECVLDQMQWGIDSVVRTHEEAAASD